jgi:hypothetical protein
VEGVGEVGSLEDSCHGADEVRPLKLEPLLKTPSATTTAPGLMARGKVMDALCNVYISVQTRSEPRQKCTRTRQIEPDLAVG